jgi:hypothetical protein
MAEIKRKVENYAEIVEQRRLNVIELVKNGVESDEIECKREWSLKRDDRFSQLRFVKLVQAIANTSRTSEGYLVIGADNKTKAFYNVKNRGDFDAADVTSFLSSYLDPPPLIQIYNNLSDGDGNTFVLVVFPPGQNRPVTLKKEGSIESEKFRLRAGEVWIKAGTATSLANRRQLDEMYDERLDQSAETLARRRFAHLRDELRLNQNHYQIKSGSPRKDMIIGPRSELTEYFLDAAETDNSPRIKMLIELMRDILVTEWVNKNVGVVPSSGVSETNQFADYVSGEVKPAIVALAEIAMLAIKYEIGKDIVRQSTEILREHFDVTSKLTLRGSNVRLLGEAQLPDWTTCMEVYSACRCIGSYLVSRGRIGYLTSAQRHFVTRYTNAAGQFGSPKVPLLFLPFRLFDSPELLKQKGQADYVWESWIRDNFGQYFMGFSDYKAAAITHEVILEFNSFFGLGLFKNPDQSIKRERNAPDFTYRNELWRFEIGELAPALIELGKLIDTAKVADVFIDEDFSSSDGTSP